MPLPKPKPKEEKIEFMARCMGALKEFKDLKQRYAVCLKQWKK